MKLNLYLLTILTFLSVQAFSQDKIYKKNGEVVEAKIVEVLEGEIKYKLFFDQNGPLYTVDKDRLTKIIYQTGREEAFTGSLRDAALYADQSRKAIKLNFLSPLAGYTQLSYEQNVKPGRSYELTLGIIGLGKRQKVDSYETNTDGSADFYRNAGGAFLGAGYKFIKLPNFVRNGDKYSHILQGLYAKPEIMLGAYSQNKSPRYLNSSRNTEKETVAFGAVIINLGKQWVLGDAFILDFYGGLGYALDNQSTDELFDNYGGNHFGIIAAGDSGLGFSGGFKIGMLLDKKKKK
ncbi:MAG TPA: hypothetical protein VGB63_03495 [Pedobacter sp.]|jgi:hypothetical protein